MSGTKPLGFMEDGEGGVMELRNCKACGSSLSMGADEDVAAAVGIVCIWLAWVLVTASEVAP